MAKVFCDYCGAVFDTDIPLLNEHGLHNDIPCPSCGSWCVNEYTPAECEASCERLNAEEEAEIWRASDEYED